MTGRGGRARGLGRIALPAATHYDLPLVLVVLGLLAIGLAMVFSSSGIVALEALDDPRHFLVQQSLWAAIGLCAMVAAAGIDYHRYRALALPLLVLAVILLAIVLLPGIGTRAGGATRWLRFSSSLGIQPAELAKLALILYLAFWLARRRESVAGAAVTGPFVGLLGLVGGLVVAQPDLGTAIIVVSVALAVYFAAGARLLAFGAIGALAAVTVAALAVAQPYRLQRLLTFVDPWSDPRGAGFQTIQGLYGFALGGPFGEGLGAGKEKFGWLPNPATDSIFAVLGNELGLVGTTLVILLFLLLAFRGARIALRAPDDEGALIATGITVWLAFQAWLNMAVVASLVPMTGITLPFISYGGSSLVVGMLAVGILLSVGRQGAIHGELAPALPGAPRGRGDGRPRQPAAGRRRSAPRARPGRALPVRGWPARPRG